MKRESDIRKNTGVEENVSTTVNGTPPEGKSVGIAVEQLDEMLEERQGADRRVKDKSRIASMTMADTNRVQRTCHTGVRGCAGRFDARVLATGEANVFIVLR